MPAFLQVTLRRSAVGLPQRTRDALAALGLRRRSQTVVHAVNPSVAGLVFQVKELVQVAEVPTDRRETLAALKAARRPAAGFAVARRYESGRAEAAAAAAAAAEAAAGAGQAAAGAEQTERQ